MLIALGLIELPACASAQETDRGAYMAYVTGCVSCHSPHDAAGQVPKGRLLAGGDYPIHVAGGPAIYPPNVTPDRETGIAGWTEQNIVAVLHEERTPDGRILSAAMPWRTQFSGLTNDDMLAIARYVLAVAPAQAEKPAAARSRQLDAMDCRGYCKSTISGGAGRGQAQGGGRH